MKLHYLTALIVGITPWTASNATDVISTVSVDQAKRLVEAAIPAGARRRSQFGIDQYEDKNFPQFDFFEATGLNSRSTGSVVIGNYAVDPATGDVFSAVQCKVYSNAGLRKLQKEIRARIRLSESEYSRIKKKGPYCE